MSSMPVHVAIVVHISLVIIKAFDKVTRSFIWTGTEAASSGQCHVAWQTVTRSIELGSLNVLDLTTLGYALHLRWE
jgi:hypothetical protein